MSRFLLISSIVTLSVLISIFWLVLLGRDAAPVVPVDQVPVPSQYEQGITTIKAENKISSLSGKLYEADRLLTDSNTEKITPGYFWNTADEQRYAIGYVESQGLITVMLLDANLALSRQLAEAQLKNLFPYSEEEFCEMNIRVYTNENVVPEYNGEYLGLSFCPFSVDL